MKNETEKRILSSIIIVPIALFFILKGSFFFVFFMSVFFLVTSYEWYKMSKKKEYLYPGIIFLIFSSYATLLLRGNNDENLLTFLIVILICVSTDLGGYIFGKIFKGPKLTQISPNKTYAGMFGGYFLSIILVNIFMNYSHSLGITNSRDFTQETLVIILLISSVSQIGDLIISYFKRLSKIKNTGKLLPGHGGLLDRVDGLIFAVPFAYILFKFI